MKDKLVRVWLFEDWELEQQQAWLSDMARQGWHLHRLKPLVTFTKGTPAHMRYRCDVAEADNDEQLALYAAAGWEYVGRRRNTQIYRAPEDASIPEIYTDSSEQAFTLRLLTRGLWQSTAAILGFLSLFILTLLASDGHVALLLSARWLDVLALLLLMQMLWVSLLGLVHLARLRGKLQRGQPLTDIASHKGRHRYRHLMVPTILLIAVIVLVGNVQGRIERLRQPRFPPITVSELAVPRLGDLLEQAGYTEYGPSQTGAFLYESAGGDVYNYYREKASLFVPSQQEIREKLDVPAARWADGTLYSPIMQVTRYRARWPSLARQLAAGLAHQKTDLFRLGELKASSLPGIDGYWQRSQGNTHAFILVKGNVVFEVFYHGLEPFEQVLELVQRALITSKD